MFTLTPPWPGCGQINLQVDSMAVPKQIIFAPCEGMYRGKQLPKKTEKLLTDQKIAHNV